MRVNWSEPLRLGSNDLRVCRDLLQQGSKSFHAASLLLPPRIIRAAAPLYAFCRVADDTIDLSRNTPEGLAILEKRLSAIVSGCPGDVPVDRAFAAVLEQYQIPTDLPRALLEGFEWETERREYQTLSDVYAYSARVAGAVGAMMTLIMGRRDQLTLRYATDLGVAMQLTNIARDVGEDARRGRIYLPLEWLRDRGVDPARFKEHPSFTPALGAVVRDLLDRADRLYHRASTGISRLPTGCRPAIYAARYIYADIGRVIAEQQFDSVSSRAVTTPARKALLLAKSVAVSLRAGSAPGDEAPGLDETEFLVRSVNESSAEQAPFPLAEPVGERWAAPGLLEVQPIPSRSL